MSYDFDVSAYCDICDAKHHKTFMYCLDLERSLLEHGWKVEDKDFWIKGMNIKDVMCPECKGECNE